MSASLIWFLLGVALFFFELVSTTFVFFFFGIGCVVASIISLIGLDFNYQIIVFIIVSIVSLLVLRKRLSSIFSGKASLNKDNENRPNHPLVGRTGIVSKDISIDCYGEIDIDGSFWRASSDTNLKKGTTVKVIGTKEEDALLLEVSSI